MTKKLNKQVYSLQKQCSFHIFLIGTSIDPCFRYRDSQEWKQSSPVPQAIFCLMLCEKARKSFHSVLPCLVMMYQQTNLDCKVSVFLRSSKNDWGLDLEHRKMIFLNDTLADDDASPYIWLIRDIVQANIHWNSEPPLWPWPWLQQSNFFTRYSSLWTCTVKPSWSPKKISS